MGKRGMVSQPGAPSPRMCHHLSPCLGRGPAVCRICPPSPTVKEQPGRAVSGWQQGYPGGRLEEPSPTCVTPGAWARQRVGSSPSPAAGLFHWLAGGLGEGLGGRRSSWAQSGGPEKRSAQPRVRGEGAGRASPRLTSLRNKGAFLHACPGRVCLPGCCHRCREHWPVGFFFFFFLTFLPFLSLFPSFWFPISDF